MSQSKPRRFANHSTTRTVWRITSGPMPSPGSTIRFRRLRIKRQLPTPRSVPIDPRTALPVPRLEVRNLAIARERHLDLLKAFEERPPLRAVDLECDPFARRRD